MTQDQRPNPFSYTPPGTPPAYHLSTAVINRNDPVSASARARSERQTADSAPGSRAAVAVACTNCRSRHLKCDGKQPCSRCVAEKINDCSYMKSRRGWKGPRKQDQSLAYSTVTSVSNTNSQGLARMYSLSPTLDSSLLETTGLNSETLSLTSPTGGISLELLSPINNQGPLVITPPPAAQLPMDTSAQGLVNAFFVFFFPAHPFVLPYAQTQELFRGLTMNHLQLALQFIGSFFVIGAERDLFEASIRGYINNFQGQRNHYFVQTIVLFSIGLHMADKGEESSEMMYLAIDVARNLGMDQRNYATAHGGVNTILEECLRRTWWEIWILDGMMTGVNMTYKMQLAGVNNLDMPLPSEESDYAQSRTQGIIKTLVEFDNHFIIGSEDDDGDFSSGTYRIDAIRIVHSVISATRVASPTHEDFLMAEAKIKNWAMYLPERKRKPIDRDGNVDEVLFEAHMIVSACTIMLNRPRSDLYNEEVQGVTTCIGANNMTLPSQYKEYHTANSMNAAMNICLLIKMPCPLVKHSPFFTCAITMASVVYLAYWSFIVTEERDRVIKEHIRLNIGSLKSIATVMPIARTVLEQVKGVARELFTSKRAIRNNYYTQGTREQILNGMIEDVTPENLVLSPHNSVVPMLTWGVQGGIPPS